MAIYLLLPTAQVTNAIDIILACTVVIVVGLGDQIDSWASLDQSADRIVLTLIDQTILGLISGLVMHFQIVYKVHIPLVFRWRAIWGLILLIWPREYVHLLAVRALVLVMHVECFI